MILHDILSQYSFEQIFSDLSDMMPMLQPYRLQMEECYGFLMSQTPVTSKKKIVYKLIDAQDSDDCFVGAEDRCFEAQWNVITGKEVEIEDDVIEEIDNHVIAVNSFLCILLIGFPPRRFAEFKATLLGLLQ